MAATRPVRMEMKTGPEPSVLAAGFLIAQNDWTEWHLNTNQSFCHVSASSDKVLEGFHPSQLVRAQQSSGAASVLSFFESFAGSCISVLLRASAALAFVLECFQKAFAGTLPRLRNSLRDSLRNSLRNSFAIVFLYTKKCAIVFQ